MEARSSQFLAMQEGLRALSASRVGRVFFKTIVDTPLRGGFALFCATQSRLWSTRNDPEHSALWAGLANVALRSFPRISSRAREAVLSVSLLRFDRLRTPLLLALSEAPLTAWGSPADPRSMADLAQSFAVGWVAMESQMAQETHHERVDPERIRALETWLLRGSEPFLHSEMTATPALSRDGRFVVLESPQSSLTLSDACSTDAGSNPVAPFFRFSERTGILSARRPNPFENRPFCLSLLALSAAAQRVEEGSLSWSLWQSMARRWLAIVERQELGRELTPLAQVSIGKPSPNKVSRNTLARRL